MSHAKQVANPPNILIIMADDLGFSDLGCYGSEIETPRLDALARHGVLMRSFYCAPFCSPSRAMLHTGLDAHLVGFGALKEVMDPRQAGKPGYEMHLNDRAPTIAERLLRSGYETFLSGKWHLGRHPQHWPSARGFQRSFGLIDGSASHFSDMATWSNDPACMPQALFQENGQVTRFSEHGSYSTEVYTQWLMRQLQSRSEMQVPFFAMLNYTAPHFPLHAPDGDIARYDRTYQAGYDAIRRRRWERQQEMGWFGGIQAPAQSSAKWPKWEELSPGLQALEARNMAVYAAMVSNMDRHIGMLLDTLERMDQLDDTLVIFLSDNGAEGNSVLDTERTREWVHRQMDNSLANRGRPGSFIEQGPGWAQVSNTPLRMYKSFTYEGGIRVPFIAKLPRQSGLGHVCDCYAHVTDIVPTLLDLAGIDMQAVDWPRPIPALPGRSMLPAWRAQSRSVHAGNEWTGWEMQGRNALRCGRWKLVHCNQPWGGNAWELYDVESDPAESRNLAGELPEQVGTMLRSWHDYVQRNGVVVADDMADSMVYSNACRYYEDLAHDLAQEAE